MAKTNDGGATAAGMSGIVEHGAPLPDGRVFSELDPELNLDGTLIKGEHPDHAKAQKRNVAVLGATDPVPQPVDETDPEKTPETEQEEETSPGGSSKASSKRTANTSPSTGNRR
jgi:hypothetical protein